MFYLYAIPHGSLRDQIERFRTLCGRDFGYNRAHDYPVHLTLTRSFLLNTELISSYQSALTRHFAETKKPNVSELRHIPKKQLVLLELEVLKVAESTFNWVKELERSDIQVTHCNFHVTLAWQTRFHARIFRLAKEIINPFSDVQWEVCLCQRSRENIFSDWRILPGIFLN